MRADILCTYLAFGSIQLDKKSTAIIVKIYHMEGGGGKRNA